MNINEIRAQEPDWANLDDMQIVRVLHEMHYPDMSPEQIAKAIGAKEPEAPAQPRSWARVAGDVGVSALKGAIGVPEAAVGLADIATGGRVGKFLENEDGVVGFRPKQAKAMLDDLYSDQQKQAFKAVNDADGVGGKFVAALQNPSVVGHSIVESVPSMAAGGVVGRGVAAVAPRVAGAFGGAGGAAIGEGVVGAGSAAEQIRQETPGGTLTGTQAGLAAASGVGTTAFGLLGGKVAKSLGIHDVDVMLAGAIQSPAKAKGIVRRVLEGAASEGIVEELPQSIHEQVTQNLALGKPLDEGVDQAAVLGLLSGAAMGGGVNVFQGKPAANDPSDTAVPAANDPLALPAPTITVGPDGTAQTADQRQSVRDDLEARAGQIVEKGPLARAAQTATGQVTDVEPKPAGALAKAAATIQPEGVPSESASDQAPADEVGEQLPGEGGAQLPDAASAAVEPGLAGSVADSVLAEGAPVGADQAAQPAGVDAAPAAPVATEPAAEPQGPEVFPTYEEADAFRKEQKARGATIQALPVPAEGGFSLAAKGTPDYENGEALREERRIAKERADAGLLDGDILNSKGAPFTIRLPANNAAKRAGPGYAVVSVKGGFVVRKEHTNAEPEARAHNEQNAKPDVQQLDGDARSVRQPIAPWIQGLRGEGGDGVSAVGGLRDVPGGRGRAPEFSPHAGQAGEQQGLPAGQRSVGDEGPAKSKPQQQPAVDTRRGDDGVGRVGEARGASPRDAGSQAQPGRPPGDGADARGVDAVQAEGRAENAHARRQDAHPGAVGEGNRDQRGRAGQPGAAGTLERGEDSDHAARPADGPEQKGQVVEHTSGRGRVLRGVWRADLSKEQAEAIDASTWNVRGKGWFIREAHLEKLPPIAKAPAAPAPAPAPAPTRPRVVVNRLGPDGLTDDERAAGKKPHTDAPAPAEASKNPDLPAGKSAVSSKSEPAAPAVGANKIFSEDAAAAARARMKKKLGTAMSGIDPELLQDGITLAGYHIEKGARTFAAYAKAMLEDMGEGIRPYLKQLYMALKFDPRATAIEGLDSAAAVEAADLESIAAAAAAADTGAPKDGNAARQLDQPSPRALEGAPSEDVRAPGEVGQARAGADGSRGGDLQRDSGADDAGRDVAGSVGAGSRDVPVPARGTRAAAPDAKKPGVSRAPRPDARQEQLRPEREGLTPEGGRNEAPNAPPIAAPQVTAEDFTIEDDLGLGEGGQKTKYRNNVAAIRLLNELEASGRLATPDEQRVLAKYVGWGGLPQAFDPKNADWAKEHAELTALLSADDLADARRSTRYAHYTSRPIIVDGIYAALRRFGFTGARPSRPAPAWATSSA